MKKLIFSLSMLLITSLSVIAKGPKPKLFPELEKYYAGLTTVPVEPSHEKGLGNLEKYILQGMGSDRKIDLLFTDKDNSFVSASAQIVLQSLLAVNKYNKMGVSSCGYQAGEINPILIKVLSKHGYKVTEASAVNGKKAYTVAFGDNVLPVNVYSKTADDATLPKANFFQMKLCSAGDNACADLKGAFFKETAPFTDPSADISEDEADKLFSQIAAEIVSAFNKAKNP